MSEESKYVAEEPPLEPKQVGPYLSQELRRVENAIEALSRFTDVRFIDSTADASASQVIMCDASASQVVVNLPGASAHLSTQYRFIKTRGANNVIVRTTETINGVGSATLSSQYQTLDVISDGKEWFEL